MRAARFAGRVSLLVFAFVLPAASTSAQNYTWRSDLATWRSQHAADLRKPDGWLSLAGLEWLQPGDNSFGSAPDNKIHLPARNPAHLGILRLESDTVTLLPPTGGFPKDLLLDGAPATSQALRAVANKDKLSPHLTIGTLNLYVIRREARFALRIKDSQSPAITGFHGLQWYEPDLAFRVVARWIPYSSHKTITLATLVGTSYDQPVPGTAEFSLGGL